jgi:hypothetical protein
MDVTGHHTLSDVGEQLLKDALKRSNHKPMRLGAFYMGNWLTDVSQFVDPVVYKKQAGNLKALVNAMFERMLDDAPSWIMTALDAVGELGLLTDLRKKLTQARAELIAEIDAFLGEGRNGLLAKKLRAVFKYLGFFKFVLSDSGHPPDKMHRESFFAIFDRYYTQYYPHEHLDRPEIQGKYATKKASGPLNRYRRKTKGRGDLYEYLRNNIKVAAGALAYLDGGIRSTPPHLSWAAATFHPRQTVFHDEEGKPQAIHDECIAWNSHLAQLGHALHAVEDFFAHSTFVEHACASLPDTYQRLQHFEDQFEHQEVLARRLKEWQPGFDAKKHDWRELPNDTHVVTGYFDGADTIISMAHFIDNLFDRPHDTLSAAAESVMEYKYKKLLTDTLELCENPKAIWDNPANDPHTPGYDEDTANLAVKALREKGGHSLRLVEGKEDRLNRVAHLLTEHDLLKDQPPEIRAAFVEAVKALGGVVGVGMMAVSLYKVMKDVATFIENPLAWLEKYVSGQVKKLLLEFGEVYLKNLVLNYIGANRIGCHSLIAKDGGPELLHKASTDCAKAVHWYVVNTLIRHAREQIVQVSRSDEGFDVRNSIYRWEWIEWLELLEAFLCHPLAETKVVIKEHSISVSKLHTTAPHPGSIMSSDSLASLAQKYAPTFMPVPRGPLAMTWEVIADANFPTAGMSTKQRMNQINKVLRHQPANALPVSDGVNYAFRPGVQLVIPYQRALAPEFQGENTKNNWWYPVIVDSWKVVKDWYANGRYTSNAPAHIHRWIPVQQKEQIELVQEANSLRERLAKEYDSG